MKTNNGLALAVLAGVLIGIAGAKAMHAGQVTAPPAYVISEVDAMDLAGIQKYGEKVGDTLAPFNGHYHFLIGGGARIQALDGEPPKGIVVLAFDNAEKARQWYDSPAYEAIKPIRLSATKGRMFIVEGLAPPVTDMTRADYRNADRCSDACRPAGWEDLELSVGAKEKMNSIGRPLPELPVADAERAQYP